MTRILRRPPPPKPPRPPKPPKPPVRLDLAGSLSLEHLFAGSTAPLRIRLEGGGGDNNAVLLAIGALSRKLDDLAVKIEALIATPEQIAAIQAATKTLGGHVNDINATIDDATKA